MPNFHRYYIPDSIIFITSVTYNRKPFLRNQNDINLFWRCVDTTRQSYPFDVLAYVILPDHFHWLMQMAGENSKFSKALQLVKGSFTTEYKRIHAIEGSLNVWQPRFWDHIIRNDDDLKKHFNYIHWNPIKHGYVKDALDWKQSSIQGWYDDQFQFNVDEIQKMNFE